MTGTTTKGTCPACFRLMALSRGKLSRHGWREQGGRRVGEYERAWHVGACFGVGWDPFEISPDGTVAYVKKVLVPTRTGIENRLEHLATRPPITLRLKTPYHREKDLTNLPFEVRLRPGDPERSAYREDSYGLTPYGSIPSYEKALGNELVFWQGQLEAVVRETDRCLKAIDTWEPRPLKEAPKKRSGRVVHLAKIIEQTYPQVGGPPKVVRREVAACGYYRMGFGRVLVSPDIEDVSCPKCLATVQKNRRRSQRRRSRPRRSR